MVTMQVETFEVQEVAEEGADLCEEAVRLVEELELEGQRSLSTPDTDARRNPYRVMTVEEAFVYGVLLPRHVPVQSYADGPIPLRVLQVLAHAKSLNFFKSFEVWCPQVPQPHGDPLLIASPNWSTFYPLARWGEVLDSFPTLLTKAAKLFRETFKDEAAHIQSDLASDAERVATMHESVIIHASLPRLQGGLNRDPRPF